MFTQSIPSAMRAWQFSSTAGGLENNLKLSSSAPLPQAKQDQHLVQVLAASVNPVDYKVAEIPLFTRLFLSKPAIPVGDFAGRIVVPASGSPLEPGQLVFGRAGTGITGGALAEYAIAKQDSVTPLPKDVSPAHGASVAVVGLTAYQSISPYVKDGSSIFINGGSGGTGCFGIQIAKAIGCHVTVTCSTENVELCKTLGADEVIDYKRHNVVEALISSGRLYDHVVDNVGADENLFWKCADYTRSGAVYVTVGAAVSWKSASDLTKRMLLPRFLGGSHRKHVVFGMVSNPEELAQIGDWMSSGKVKAIIDAQLPFEKAPDAFRRLKTGRAKGKIVVKMTEQ